MGLTTLAEGGRRFRQEEEVSRGMVCRYPDAWYPHRTAGTVRRVRHILQVLQCHDARIDVRMGDALLHPAHLRHQSCLAPERHHAGVHSLGHHLQRPRPHGAGCRYGDLRQSAYPHGEHHVLPIYIPVCSHTGECGHSIGHHSDVHGHLLRQNHLAVYHHGGDGVHLHQHSRALHLAYLKPASGRKRCHKA